MFWADPSRARTQGKRWEWLSKAGARYLLTANIIFADDIAQKNAGSDYRVQLQEENKKKDHFKIRK